MMMRSEQMGDLTSGAQRRADTEMVDYARRRFPTKFAQTPQETMMRIVKEIRNRAAGDGFEREDHVASYLDFTVMYGPDFSRSEWAQPILENDAYNVDQKIQALSTRVEETGVKL